MRIEITRAILAPRLSDFLRLSTIHFRMLLYLVTESHGFVAKLSLRNNGLNLIYFSIYSFSLILTAHAQVLGIKPKRGFAIFDSFWVKHAFATQLKSFL